MSVILAMDQRGFSPFDPIIFINKLNLMNYCVWIQINFTNQLAQESIIIIKDFEREVRYQFVVFSP